MIGYLYNPNSYQHDTGMHLEIDERCQLIDALVREKYDVKSLPLYQGSKKDLEKVHDISYITWLEHGYENGVRMIISSDTIVSEGSYDVALLTATSTKSVIDFFQEGGSRAFLNIRPPGHHAEIITGQGFCLFNNVALMARYAQDAGYEKVLIIDFDVHHGNGTQDIFYHDNSVFYFSTHEKNNYPFTGAEEEIGKGIGKGFTKNMPYDDYISDADFLKLFDALPKDFSPDIVLVSAGYDLMKDEEISSAQITFEGLASMVKKIVGTYHDKPIAFILEGGYNLDSLVKSVDTTLKILSESVSA
jgi:acetoin utilization deacetylase AcuC-like enzyme